MLFRSAAETRLKNLQLKKESINAITHALETTKVTPQEANEFLQQISSAQIGEKTALATLLKRPEIGIKELLKMSESFSSICQQHQPAAIEQAEITLKYQVYIEREEQMAQKIASLENYRILPDFDYDRVKALSSEAREKLKRVKPETIGQMSRISGVSPSDVSILTVYLGK